MISLESKILDQFIALLIRDLKLKTVFKWYFTISVVDSILNVILLFLMIVFGGGVIEGYRFSYLEFILTGVIVQKFLSICVSTPYNAIYSYYMKGLMDLISLEGKNIVLLLLPNIFLGLITGFIDVFIILFIASIFHINILHFLSLTFFSILFLGILSGIGVGFIAASMLYLVDARTGSNPILWLYDLFSILVSGAYYPIDRLPLSLQLFSLLLPNTYILDIVRRFSGVIDYDKHILLIHIFPLDIVLIDFIFLILISVVYGLLGLFLIRISLDKAKIDGRISRWV